MPSCLIVGCRRSLRVSVFLCDDHAVDAWEEVEAVRDTPASPVAGVVVPRKPAYMVGEQWIYYLQLDSKIKIGWTSNYVQRMKAYPPHAVVLVRHPGTRADERDLHRSFKPSRVAGREWYAPTQELMAHIERAKTAETQRRADEHMARVSAAADEEDTMNAAWPGSAALRMYRDDPLSTMQQKCRGSDDASHPPPARPAPPSSSQVLNFSAG